MIINTVGRYQGWSLWRLVVRNVGHYGFSSFGRLAGLRGETEEDARIAHGRATQRAEAPRPARPEGGTKSENKGCTTGHVRDGVEFERSKRYDNR